MSSDLEKLKNELADLNARRQAVEQEIAATQRESSQGPKVLRREFFDDELSAAEQMAHIKAGGKLID